MTSPVNLNLAPKGNQFSIFDMKASHIKANYNKSALLMNLIASFLIVDLDNW